MTCARACALACELARAIVNFARRRISSCNFSVIEMCRIINENIVFQSPAFCAGLCAGVCVGASQRRVLSLFHFDVIEEGAHAPACALTCRLVAENVLCIFLFVLIVQLRCSGSSFVIFVGAGIARREVFSICDVGPNRVFVSFSCCRFAHDRFGSPRFHSGANFVAHFQRQRAMKYLGRSCAEMCWCKF